MCRRLESVDEQHGRVIGRSWTGNRKQGTVGHGQDALDRFADQACFRELMGESFRMDFGGIAESTGGQESARSSSITTRNGMAGVAVSIAP
ncbi:TPA: hypothetical protein DCE37_08035, partial [Candidatus Latescibacteria bacterium]|nr:hypothetical protein [Candidatus Latescibacterota bacterium]